MDKNLKMIAVAAVFLLLTVAVVAIVTREKKVDNFFAGPMDIPPSDQLPPLPPMPPDPPSATQNDQLFSDYERNLGVELDMLREELLNSVDFSAQDWELRLSALVVPPGYQDYHWNLVKILIDQQQEALELPELLEKINEAANDYPRPERNGSEDDWGEREDRELFNETEE